MSSDARSSPVRARCQQQANACACEHAAPWTCSSALPDSKYTKVASDLRMANHLQASSFCATDMRRTAPPPRQRYDTQHYHAFTRGEATTGWDHSTEPPRPWQREQQQRRLDARAFAGTAKVTRALTRYQSPPQREEAFAGALRQQKEAAAAQAASLVQRFGPEGAAAMQQILAMRRPCRRPVQIKATREDVAAVHQLPAVGLGDEPL